MLFWRHISLSLLILCSLHTRAQRQIEWYEPDFDSSYAHYDVMYGARWMENHPHYNQFWSQTAKRKGIKLVKRKKVLGESDSTVEVTAFTRDGFINAYTKIVYKRHDTLGILLDKYFYDNLDSFLQIRVEKFEGAKVDSLKQLPSTVFVFNNQLRLDSAIASCLGCVGRKYGYDELGQVSTINGVSVSRFSEGEVYGDKEWTEHVSKLMGRDLPERRISEVLKKERAEVVQGVSLGYPDDNEKWAFVVARDAFFDRNPILTIGQQAEFLQFKNERLQFRSGYRLTDHKRKYGVVELQYRIARKKGNKWNVIDYHFGKRHLYTMKVDELPEWIEYSEDEKDTFVYQYY